jgi:glycosyltransferase involved in cell wall biosynthesis
LVAGVPRIVLGVRTLPPIDRVARWRLELEPIFRLLLASPGVTLAANSAQAARRYEHWLDLPKGAVPLIRNGVSPLDPAPHLGDEHRWNSFVGNAQPDLVVGGVMRLDGNKRPFEWMEIAAELVARRPRARFVLVGEGPLGTACRDYAQRRGLGDRLLFVGRSQSVGYWLARMDALLLTSRFEGTPNVLIEAQLAGVPVVTTPAGGAADALIHGETGFVLSAVEQVDIAEAADRLSAIADLDPIARIAMRERARAHATATFDLDAMLRRTVAVLAMDASVPFLPLPTHYIDV